MKSKLTTYVLLTVVVVVWGIIVWKFFFQQPKQEHVMMTRHDPVKKGIADTLLLSYPDPFLDGKEVGKKEPVTASAAKRIETQPAPKLPALPAKPITHNVKYVGTIAKNKNSYSLVEINGSLNTMKAGDETCGYELVRVYADSLLLVKDGDTLTVKLSK